MTNTKKSTCILCLLAALFLVVASFFALFVPGQSASAAIVIPPEEDTLEYLSFFPVDSTMGASIVYKYTLGENFYYNFASFTGYNMSFFAITPSHYYSPLAYLTFSVFGSQWYSLSITDNGTFYFDRLNLNCRTFGTVSDVWGTRFFESTPTNMYYHVSGFSGYDLSNYAIDAIDFYYSYSFSNYNYISASYSYKVWFTSALYDYFYVDFWFNFEFTMPDFSPISSVGFNTPFDTVYHYFTSPGSFFGTIYLHFNTDFDAQYEQGFNDGKESANNTVTPSSASYSAGYTQGLNDAGNYTFFSLISSVIDVPVQAFLNLFDFDILGVNLRGFFASLLAVCLVIIVVKFALGR